jgi:hypothetical protein
MLFEQELAGCITEELYEKSIPQECSMQTMELHNSMMLCWGLMASIRKGQRQDCSGCDENKTNHAAMLERIAQRKKEKESCLPS